MKMDVITIGDRVPARAGMNSGGGCPALDLVMCHAPSGRRCRRAWTAVVKEAMSSPSAASSTMVRTAEGRHSGPLFQARPLSVLRGCPLVVAAVRSCPETSPMPSTRVSSAWMTASLAVTGTCSGGGHSSWSRSMITQASASSGTIAFATAAKDSSRPHRILVPAQCGAPCVLDVVGRGDPFLHAAVAKDGHTPRRHMTVRAVGSPHPERCPEQPGGLLGEGGMPLLW